MGAAALVRRPLLLSGGGHLCSMRRVYVTGWQSSKFRPAFMTARVAWRAVAINEINLYRLKARILAGSHQSSDRLL